ncbi:MAG: hypothetical protein QOD28_2088 [Acidobacteriota bacterium]|nr:hypothetical protein [Acidobacteriota bacterium]
MSRKKKVLSEDEIDDLVTGQADDATAWDKPVRVQRSQARVSALSVAGKPTLVGNNFQRVGSLNNTQVGREFEEAAQLFFAKTGIPLQPSFAERVGYRIKKAHKFDLGSKKPPILVECKSYTWTSGGNSPSAKIRGLNEVMLLFSLAPKRYRKILFVLKHLRKDVSLAAHYIKTQGHLIGPGIEIWEFDLEKNYAEQVFPHPDHK